MALQKYLVIGIILAQNVLIVVTTVLNILPAFPPPAAAPSPDVDVLSTVVVVAPPASMVTLFVVLVTSISALADPWIRVELRSYPKRSNKMVN